MSAPPGYGHRRFVPVEAVLARERRHKVLVCCELAQLAEAALADEKEILGLKEQNAALEVEMKKQGEEFQEGEQAHKKHIEGLQRYVASLERREIKFKDDLRAQASTYGALCSQYEILQKDMDVSKEAAGKTQAFLTTQLAAARKQLQVVQQEADAKVACIQAEAERAGQVKEGQLLSRAVQIKALQAELAKQREESASKVAALEAAAAADRSSFEVQLQAAQAQAQEVRRALEARVTDMGALLQAVRNEAVQQASAAEGLRQQLALQTEALEAAVAERSNETAAREATQAALADSQLRIEEMTAVTGELRVQLAAAVEGRQAVNMALQAEQGHCNTLQAEIISLQTNITSLHAEVADGRAAAAKWCASAIVRGACLKAQVRELEQSLHNSHTTNTALAAAKAAAEEGRTAAEVGLINLQADKGQLQVALAAVESNSRCLNAQLQGSRAQVQQLQGTLQQENMAYEAQFASLNAEVADGRAAAVQGWSSATVSAAFLKAQVRELEQKLRTANTTNTALAAAKASTEEGRTAAEVGLINLQGLADRLQAQVASLAAARAASEALVLQLRAEALKPRGLKKFVSKALSFGRNGNNTDGATDTTSTTDATISSNTQEGTTTAAEVAPGCMPRCVQWRFGRRGVRGPGRDSAWVL